MLRSSGTSLTNARSLKDGRMAVARTSAAAISSPSRHMLNTAKSIENLLSIYSVIIMVKRSISDSADIIHLSAEDVKSQGHMLSRHMFFYSFEGRMVLGLG